MPRIRKKFGNEPEQQEEEEKEDFPPELRGTPIVGEENMITMDNLTETTLLKNIELRYNSDLIYVRCCYQTY